MELKDIIPQKVSIRLSRLDRPLLLNMITLDDNAWMAEQYPGDEMLKVYNEGRVADILRIVSRLLDHESKRFLAKVEIVEFDEKGQETKLTNLTLADKLYKLTADGEIGLIIQAIFDVRTRSNEIVNKVRADLTQKKTEQQEKNQNGK